MLKRIYITVLACLLLSLATGPAMAGWHTTKWGASKEQVEKSLGQTLRHIKDAVYIPTKKITLLGDSFQTIFLIPPTGFEMVIFDHKGADSAVVCANILKRMDHSTMKRSPDNTDRTFEIYFEEGDTFIMMEMGVEPSGKQYCRINYSPLD